MLNGLNVVIKSIDDLSNGYVKREGYIFTALTHPGNVYDAIVIRQPIQADVESPIYEKSSRSLEEHISFINKYQLEKAVVIAESLDFIVKCPSLKYLHIIPANVESEFDFSPLYAMPEIVMLTCRTCDVDNKRVYGQIDYKKVKGLIDVGVAGKGHIDYNKISSLKSIDVTDIKAKNLYDVFCSKEIDTIRAICCGLKSLEGIEQSSNLTCLYLFNNRSLSDISSLKNVKSSLRALRIVKCAKIQDFSVLGELEKLEMLSIKGSNSLNDLKFLNRLKNLKTFVFDINIADGDLTPCLKLDYAACLKDRRHYNIKDKDLPKGNFLHGNEGIEVWRTLE
ncbi:MAG: hypothetical protein IJP10_02930 [Clostridia bacterium]|nr:hypothetical protein [Clostridia bacterium]